MTIKWDFSAPVLRQAAMRGLVRGGNIVRNEMLRLILRTKKSGRVYVRRGVSHQASAPGETFASDTGGTVQSMSPVVAHASELKVTITVGGEARKMEFGTSRMAARPFARPAVTNSSAAIKAAITHELKQVFSQVFPTGVIRRSSKR